MIAKSTNILTILGILIFYRRCGGPDPGEGSESLGRSGGGRRITSDLGQNPRRSCGGERGEGGDAGRGGGGGGGGVWGAGVRRGGGGGWRGALRLRDPVRGARVRAVPRRGRRGGGGGVRGWGGVAARAGGGVLRGTVPRLRRGGLCWRVRVCHGLGAEGGRYRGDGRRQHVRRSPNVL